MREGRLCVSVNALNPAPPSTIILVRPVKQLQTYIYAYRLNSETVTLSIRSSEKGFHFPLVRIIGQFFILIFRPLHHHKNMML